MQREVPDTIYYECTECDDETIHDVLKGRMGKASLECTIKCSECGRTFATTIPLPKIIKMQVVISDGPVSERTVTELEEDDIIAVEDEFFLEDGRRLRVCSIELPGDKRVKKSKASKVKMLWCQQFDNLTIKVTINNDRVSYSRRIPALPMTSSPSVTVSSWRTWTVSSMPSRPGPSSSSTEVRRPGTSSGSTESTGRSHIPSLTSKMTSRISEILSLNMT